MADKDFEKELSRLDEALFDDISGDFPVLDKAELDEIAFAAERKLTLRKRIAQPKKEATHFGIDSLKDDTDDSVSDTIVSSDGFEETSEHRAELITKKHRTGAAQVTAVAASMILVFGAGMLTMKGITNNAPTTDKGYQVVSTTDGNSGTTDETSENTEDDETTTSFSDNYEEINQATKEKWRKMLLEVEENKAVIESKIAEIPNDYNYVPTRKVECFNYDELSEGDYDYVKIIGMDEKNVYIMVLKNHDYYDAEFYRYSITEDKMIKYDGEVHKCLPANDIKFAIVGDKVYFALTVEISDTYRMIRVCLNSSTNTVEQEQSNEKEEAIETYPLENGYFEMITPGIEMDASFLWQYDLKYYLGDEVYESRFKPLSDGVDSLFISADGDTIFTLTVEEDDPYKKLTLSSYKHTFDDASTPPMIDCVMQVCNLDFKELMLEMSNPDTNLSISSFDVEGDRIFIGTYDHQSNNSCSKLFVYDINNDELITIIEDAEYVPMRSASETKSYVFRIYTGGGIWEPTGIVQMDPGGSLLKLIGGKVIDSDAAFGSMTAYITGKELYIAGLTE